MNTGDWQAKSLYWLAVKEADRVREKTAVDLMSGAILRLDNALLSGDVSKIEKRRTQLDRIKNATLYEIYAKINDIEWINSVIR